MEKEMNVKARVTPIENETSLKGIATVTICDQFAIHGVKIVNGKNGLFVSMPSEKAADGEYKSTVFPASKAAFAKMNKVVQSAYQDALANGRQEKAELAPEKVNIKVSDMRENTRQSNVKAICQITVNDVFVVQGVRVVESKNGDLFAAMPSKQDQNGEYVAVANPITKEFNEQVQRAVVEKYNNRENERANIIGNVSYGTLGKDSESKTFNSKFAEKVGVELDNSGTNWSGKIDGDRTVIAVAKGDYEAFKDAVETAKSVAKENTALANEPLKASSNASEKLQNAVLTPDEPEINRGGRR